MVNAFQLFTPGFFRSGLGMGDVSTTLAFASNLGRRGYSKKKGFGFLVIDEESPVNGIERFEAGREKKKSILSIRNSCIGLCNRLAGWKEFQSIEAESLNICISL